LSSNSVDIESVCTAQTTATDTQATEMHTIPKALDQSSEPTKESSSVNLNNNLESPAKIKMIHAESSNNSRNSTNRPNTEIEAGSTKILEDGARVTTEGNSENENSSVEKKENQFLLERAKEIFFAEGSKVSN